MYAWVLLIGLWNLKEGYWFQWLKPLEEDIYMLARKTAMIFSLKDEVFPKELFYLQRWASAALSFCSSPNFDGKKWQTGNQKNHVWLPAAVHRASLLNHLAFKCRTMFCLTSVIWNQNLPRITKLGMHAQSQSTILSKLLRRWSGKTNHQSVNYTGSLGNK